MSNLVREKLEDYFASMNPTSSRMMADIMSSKQEHSKEWDSLPQEEQSGVLWRSIVKADAVTKYEEVQIEPPDEEFFPVLRTRPGEKIIVDEDASAGRPFGCSWKDEHSAPFRWETQSQLDLRINGEEPEDKVKTLEKPATKEDEAQKTETRKEDDVKRPAPVKRPEVPPPPVPPHFIPPIPVQVESPPPKPVQKKDTPIYAKVVKRKSATAKTLVLSDMKAHRKAKEDMKPAVPPRMSLELRKEIDISKYKTLPIDFDDIPKTGFDFLDNW